MDILKFRPRLRARLLKSAAVGAVTKQRGNCSPLIRSRPEVLASNRQLYENLEFPEQRRTGGSRYVGRCVGPGNRLRGRPRHLRGTTASRPWRGIPLRLRCWTITSPGRPTWDRLFSTNRQTSWTTFRLPRSLPASAAPRNIRPADGRRAKSSFSMCLLLWKVGERGLPFNYGQNCAPWPVAVSASLMQPLGREKNPPAYWEVQGQRCTFQG